MPPVRFLFSLSRYLSVSLSPTYPHSPSLSLPPSVCLCFSKSVSSGSFNFVDWNGWVCHEVLREGGVGGGGESEVMGEIFQTDVLRGRYYTHTHIQIHTHTPTHTYTDAHIHRCTYIYTHTPSSSCAVRRAASARRHLLPCTQVSFAIYVGLFHETRSSSRHPRSLPAPCVVRPSLLPNPPDTHR